MFFFKVKNLPSLPCLTFHHEIKNERKRRTGNEKLLQLSFEYGNVARMRRKGFGRLADLLGQVWLLSPAQELKLSQHPATRVTLAVELNPCLGQRGSFCSPVKYSAFPKSHLLTHFVLITPSAHPRLIIRYPISPPSLHTRWVGFVAGMTTELFLYQIQQSSPCAVCLCLDKFGGF